MRRLRLTLCAFVLLPVLTICACAERGETLELTFKTPDGKVTPPITAEIAKTPDQRMVGLMYRREMEPQHGMLFIFPDTQPRSFWMKNTYLELDMVFIDEHEKVVSVVEHAAPLTLEPRPSVKSARYVLELLGGKAKEWGITPGSSLVATDRLPVVTE